MHEWQSLSHVRWDCKYHIVIIPKYRRKVFYGIGAAHQALLQVERGLRPLHAVEREARLDDVVEVVGVGLARERAQRDHAVLLLARVARLRRRARDAGVHRGAHRVDVAPGPELLAA